jgi:hypothetical protein
MQPPPISAFEIFPNYALGFSYHWALSGAVPNPSAVRYVVEEAGNARGDGAKAISPVLLNAYSWAETGRRMVSKDEGPWFRVRVSGTQLASPWITPTNTLSREDFLQLRELMRREMMQLKLKSGVEIRVYEKARFAVPCAVCRDPVTGDVRSQACPRCYGSGFSPPYYAPYDTWAGFSQAQRSPGFKQEEIANQQDYAFDLRMIPNPLVHHDDIVVDVKLQKCYFVHDTQAIAEIRRHPAVIQARVKEVPVDHPIYKMIAL